MKIISIMLILVVLFSCSAHTYNLWKENEYTEEISHLLITEDGKNIVFVGSNYDYIFKNQKLLSELLQSNVVGFIKYNVNNIFEVNEKNEIKGKYKAVCNCEKANKNQKMWFKIRGFKKENNKYYKEDEIIGTRYKSYNQPIKKYEKLDKKISVVIKEKYPNSKILEKAVMTPLALVTDTVETVVWGSLLIVASPVIAVQYFNTDK